MTALDWVIALVVALLVAIPFVGWTATFILVRAAVKRPYITFLTDRALSMALKSAGSSIIAAVAVNSYLMFVPIERPWSTLIVAVALLMLEVPAILFLWLYATGRFGDDE